MRFILSCSCQYVFLFIYLFYLIFLLRNPPGQLKKTSSESGQHYYSMGLWESAVSSPTPIGVWSALQLSYYLSHISYYNCVETCRCQYNKLPQPGTTTQGRLRNTKRSPVVQNGGAAPGRVREGGTPPAQLRGMEGGGGGGGRWKLPHRGLGRSPRSQRFLRAL